MSEAEHSAADPELRALRDRDESAFRDLVAGYHGLLRHMAGWYVRPDEVDEVLQETWTAVVRGIDRFEGRSTLRTWICQILLNQARRRHRDSTRSVPFASVAPAFADPQAPDPALLHDVLGAGYWSTVPQAWRSDPEGRILGREVGSMIQAAVDDLPGAQREVIVLRDVEGWSAAETCEALGITNANQRVLLHRARTAVRQALQEYFDEE